MDSPDIMMAEIELGYLGNYRLRTICRPDSRNASRAGYLLPIPSRYVCAYKTSHMIMSCILSLSLFFPCDKHRLPLLRSTCSGIAYHDWSGVIIIQKSFLCLYLSKKKKRKRNAFHEQNSNCSENCPKRTKVTLNFT